MVNGCMVYTELAPRRQPFHVAPAMAALKYSTSVDIKKTRYKKLLKRAENNGAGIAQWLEHRTRD